MGGAMRQRPALTSLPRLLLALCGVACLGGPLGALGLRAAEEPLDCRWAAQLEAAAPQNAQQACPGPSGRRAGDNFPFGSWAPRGPPRRLALVVRGESFRRRSRHDPNDTLTAESYADQLAATASHVDHFVRPAERCGWAVDVFFATYEHPASSFSGNASGTLARIYGEHLRGALAFPREERQRSWPGAQGGRNQDNVWNEAWRLMNHFHNATGQCYDGVFVLRHDTNLLRSPLSLPGADLRHALFSFAEGRKAHEKPKGKNWTGDMIQWIPWRLANCMSSCGYKRHATGKCIGQKAGFGEVGVFFPGVHSSLAFNPLYWLREPPPQKRNLWRGYSWLVRRILGLFRLT